VAEEDPAVFVVEELAPFGRPVAVVQFAPSRRDVRAARRVPATGQQQRSAALANKRPPAEWHVEAVRES
jgi:hypothetical protein